MKKLFTLLFIAGFLVSCYEAREVSSTRVPLKFKKSTGEEIPLNVALEWVKQYRDKFNGGRDGNQYSISADVLSLLLETAANEVNVGVALHHGKDDQDQHHILISRVIEDTDLWDVAHAADANSGSLISAEVASGWASAYSTAYPNEIWFHFFGIDMINQIRANPAFNYFEVREGLNELGPQLLLFVYNNLNSGNGRTDGDDVSVYDASSPCPPCGQN